jgi:hypothetical protein
MRTHGPEKQYMDWPIDDRWLCQYAVVGLAAPVIITRRGFLFFEFVCDVAARTTV